MLWNDRLKTYNGKDIKYDLEGNPVSYDGKSYVWNGKQLTEIKAADGSYTQYNYDASGLRTQKKQYKSDGTLEYSVDYIWKDGKISVQNMVYNIEQEKDGVVTYKPITFTSKFVYFNNENTPSAIILNGQTMLLKKNIQGDVTSIIEPSGETMISFSYDPWGNITYVADESLDETAKAVITAICPVTYRGYNYDFTTGLYYLQSRYYNPEWGRFLNADDTEIMLANPDDVFSANMYLYCDNNPVNKVDYDGYYSARKANEYAKKWWNGFNPKYKTFDRARDCANFVSQCLYEGEFSPMTLSWYNVGYGNVGKIGSSWGAANELKKWLEVRTTTATISSVIEVNFLALLLLLFKRSYCSIVIIFDNDNDGKYDHAAINGYIDPFKLDIYFYAHSVPRNGQKYYGSRAKRNISLIDFLNKYGGTIFISLLY